MQMGRLPLQRVSIGKTGIGQRETSAPLHACERCHRGLHVVAKGGRGLVIGLLTTQAILQRRDHRLCAASDLGPTGTERRTAVAPQPLIARESVGAANGRIDRGGNVDPALDLDTFEAVMCAP